MGRHFGDHNLLRDLVPRVIDAQAAFGIARVTAVLDMPIGFQASALELKPEGVLSAGRVLDAGRYDNVGKCAAAIQATVAAFSGQPKDALRSKRHVLELRFPDAPPRRWSQHNAPN